MRMKIYSTLGVFVLRALKKTIRHGKRTALKL